MSVSPSRRQAPPVPKRGPGGAFWTARFSEWDPIEQRVVRERKCKRQTKNEVQQWIDREWGVPRSDLSTMMLERFIEAHRDEILYGLGPHTTDVYRGHLKLRIVPQLGGLRLADIGSVDVERAQAKWTQAGVSSTVQAGTRNALSRVMGLAVKLGAVQSNPVLDAARPQAALAKDIRTLDQDQADELIKRLAAVGLFYADLASVALATGLRAGELYALRHTDLQPDLNRVQVQRAWAGTGSHRVVKRPKSGRTRSAPWPDSLAGVLERRWLPGEDDFVWRGPRGAVVQHSNAMRLSKFHKITKEDMGIDFTWHDLRATAIVSWIRAGIPLTTVREWAGHSSLKTTDSYARVARNDHADAMVRLNAFLARSLDQEIEGRETGGS